MNKFRTKPGVFGISFDAVPMSGVIVEFLKVAEVFHRNKYRIYLDLGYEIKADKNNFFKPYTDEPAIFPSWLKLCKIIEKPFTHYSAALVNDIARAVIQNNGNIDNYKSLIARLSSNIAEILVKRWMDLNIHVVIVENGTLPENIIYTRALYKAISSYGKLRNLGKFVLWRDHDLMWSSEFSSRKYGFPPYPNVPGFAARRHITHAVLHEADYIEANKWCPNADLSILRNSFSPYRTTGNQHDAGTARLRGQFRRLYQIPEHAYLIARFTRIIPQKRIDRDILLLHYLHKLNAEHGMEYPVYLCIAGDIKEAPQEYERLRGMISNLSLDRFVIFTGILKPVGIEISDDIRSIKNLILASDICSFLTSYDYESFGNPISEAIGLRKPYITTTYDRYQHVYDRPGYKGVKMKISRDNDGPPDKKFANDVFHLLIDKNKRKSMIQHNYQLMLRNSMPASGLVKRISKLLDINLT